MTINAQTGIAAPQLGDGINLVFPFDFKIGGTDEISVYVDGVLVASADYSVDLSEDWSGDVTFDEAPANGAEVVIASNPDFIQSSVHLRQGPFYPDIVEDDLDRAALRDIYLKREVERAFKVPLLGATALAGKFPVVMPDGTAGFASGTADGGFREDAAMSSGAALIGFLQSGTGAVARTTQAKAREVVSVKDFGAVGDGATDDTAEIQAAFNSGAKRVTIPSGTYLISSGLTVPNWLHIQGEGYQPTIGVGSGAAVFRFTQTSGVAMSLGFNPLIENLVLWNSGGAYNDTTKTLSGTTAVGMDLAADNVTLDGVAFHLWDTCIRFGPSAYYVKTRGVEFNRCTNGYRTNGVAPYNVHIDAPISRDTTNFFAGQTVNPARNVKVMGGSIEGYQSVASGVLDFAAFGTYFETIPERAGAYGIDPGVNGATVALHGCTVYMNETSRFVNMSGLTNCALSGHGNQFEGTGGSGAICYYLPSTGTVSLAGDLFGQGHNNNTLYVDSITNLAKFNGITMPLLPSGNTNANYSGFQIIGSRGFIAVGLTAAPSSPTTGQTVMADGDSWDPLARAGGRPYWTIWQGDRWRSPGGGV